MNNKFNMKAATASLILAALVSTALASPTSPTQERRQAGAFNRQSLQAYNAPNAISMEVLKQRKIDQHKKDRDAGIFDKDKYKTQSATACRDGKSGEYLCNKVDLKGFLRHQDLQSRTREGNDVWGKYSIFHDIFFC